MREDRERVVPVSASMNAGLEPGTSPMWVGKDGGALKRWVNIEEDGIWTEGYEDVYIVGDIVWRD